MHKQPQKVLVIGSGPIVIGQAAESDYILTQACESQKEVWLDREGRNAYASKEMTI